MAIKMQYPNSDALVISFVFYSLVKISLRRRFQFSFWNTLKNPAKDSQTSHWTVRSYWQSNSRTVTLIVNCFICIILQKVLASRKELLEYDCRESKGPLETAAGTGSLLLSAGVNSRKGNCYGCASAAIEHCVTLLRALAMVPGTRKQLVEEVRLLV